MPAPAHLDAAPFATQWRWPHWPRILRRLRATAARPPAPTIVVQLADNQSHVLRDAAGARLVCEAGTAWITQQDDPGDIGLRAGDAAVVQRRGKTVVLALGACRLRIERPA